MPETQPSRESPLRIAYADPPYPGQSKKHYGDHGSRAVTDAWTRFDAQGVLAV